MFQCYYILLNSTSNICHTSILKWHLSVVVHREKYVKQMQFDAPLFPSQQGYLHVYVISPGLNLWAHWLGTLRTGKKEQKRGIQFLKDTKNGEKKWIQEFSVSNAFQNQYYSWEKGKDYG